MLGLSEEAFLDAILARIPPTPPNHAQIVALNEAGEMPTVTRPISRREPTAVPSPSAATPGIRLGLLENWQQFSLLVLINAFVGGMVGLERTIVPLLAEQEFGLASRTIALSFIVSFGVVKALANLFAGRFSDRIGRKQILVAGWLFGLPVPIIIMLAPSWDWIVFANVLLGINQGLCWSTTVIMKIDLVGPARRGLAMGLNEAAGYLAVAAAPLASGYIAASYGLRPEPFYLGVVFAVAGLVLSIVFVRDSHAHARHEGGCRAEPAPTRRSRSADLRAHELEGPAALRGQPGGSRQQPQRRNGLGALSFFTAAGLPIDQIAILSALYPAVWGLGQLGTGASPISSVASR